MMTINPVRLLGHACLGLLLLGVSSAQAALITTVTATTTMGSGAGTNLLNTVNGAGLSSLSLNATHFATDPSNSWVSAAPQLAGDVTFDFAQNYSLSGFSFWNQNAGGPAVTGATGINLVNVLYSTDGVSFVALPGAPISFVRVLTGNGSVPQVVAFAPVSARAVRFSILSNHGDPNQTGFAEVAFDGTRAVPEPLTGSLLALGFAAVARRRSRSSL